MKKRIDDSIKHKDIYKAFIFTAIFFFIIILFLQSVPKIFTDSSFKLNKIFNLKEDKKNIKIFNKELEKINSLHKEKEINTQNKINQNIFAKSYVVYDVKNDKVIFSKNENTVLPLASLTKIVTAVTAINIKSRDTIITINSSKMREDEKLDFGLKENQD